MTTAVSSRPKGILSLYSVAVTAFAAGVAIQDDSIATAQTAKLPRTRLPNGSESPKTAFRSWVDGGSSVFGMANFIAVPSGCIFMTCDPYVVKWFSVVSGRNLRCIEASETLSRRVSFLFLNRTHHALPLQVLFFSPGDGGRVSQVPLCGNKL